MSKALPPRIVVQKAAKKKESRGFLRHKSSTSTQKTTQHNFLLASRPAGMEFVCTHQRNAAGALLPHGNRNYTNVASQGKIQQFFLPIVFS